MVKSSEVVFMIKKEILEKLAVITDEERAILAGAEGVDKKIYMSRDRSVIRSKKLLSDGRLIRVRTHTRFVHFPEHTHDFVEGVYMCSGSTTHVINGKTVVLREGELLFLGQNATQEILPAGEGDVAVNFIIKPAFFNTTVEMLGAEETPIKNFLVSSLLDGKNRGYLHFRVSDVLPVQNLVENLLWTLINDTANKRNINQTTMGLLFMTLLNFTDTLSCDTKEDKAIMDIFKYIEDNYRDGTLSEAAELLHYDFYWLSHEIKRRTGRTYTEHLQEKRLSQAAFLLKNTALSVEDVARNVGYENRSYFHRIFCAHFGISPKKYKVSVMG